MELDPLLIGLLGYVLGGVFRTLYDFLWKIVEEPDTSFDKKYIATLIISVIITLISSIVTFPTIQMPQDGAVTILLFTVLAGFAANHLINKPISYLTKKKSEPDDKS